jgi:sporulation protein YlmC with PRC-barrel domain
MSLVGAYFWYTDQFWASNGGGVTNTAPWTADWGIPPSSVLAISSLTEYSIAGSGGADVGYLSYVTQDPDTGQPSTHMLSPNAGLAQGLVPSFWDDHVIIITGAWNCYVLSSGIFSATNVTAVGNFTAFVRG